jgi:predicted O-linked N-acetylglucosamine transferase (SPINDLY family)
MKVERSQQARRAQVKFKEGMWLQKQGDFSGAYSCYLKALTLLPTYFDAMHMLGVVSAQNGDPANAVAWIKRAIEINPEIASAHSNLGNAFAAIQQYQEAVVSYDRAIAINPLHANAYLNRGKALYALHRLAAAIESFDQAIAIKPDFADAYCDRGVAWHALKQYNEAIASYSKAITIVPNHIKAVSNCGVAKYELGQYQEATFYYDRALAIDPLYADAHANRAAVLVEMKQLSAAVLSYDKAIELQPQYPYLHGRRLHTKMRICDWSDVAGQIAELSRRIARHEKAAPPFSVLALTNSLALQRHAAETWLKERYPENLELGKISKPIKDKKIRLGYFSADFHDHATAYLMAELFEMHNKDQFELFAFSFGPNRANDMRSRLSQAFDKFLEVSDQSDKEVAMLSRSLGIDIAIDLKGFTEGERVGIFSYRAAPIQVNYLGYPGTMGADYIDYLIADKTLIPEASQQHYAEKIVYLPHSYQVNDSKRKISDKVFTRQELGLPESGFVFCCFNNNYKITPEVFDVWMRILSRVNGSVLWLLEDNSLVASNLRQEALKRGVEPQRLIFAKRLPLADHLARHRAADLFIDTLPYNAHTTASDALWAGLPVLTCMGEAFASRVAASLLTAIGLPELITHTFDEYGTLAVALAQDPDRMRKIRQKLEHNRLTTPLFDTKLFTKNIENAYIQMYEQYHASLAPTA